jgi:hypothetical protein
MIVCHSERLRRRVRRQGHRVLRQRLRMMVTTPNRCRPRFRRQNRRSCRRSRRRRYSNHHRRIRRQWIHQLPSRQEWEARSTVFRNVAEHSKVSFQLSLGCQVRLLMDWNSSRRDWILLRKRQNSRRCERHRTRDSCWDSLNWYSLNSCLLNSFDQRCLTPPYCPSRCLMQLHPSEADCSSEPFCL